MVMNVLAILFTLIASALAQNLVILSPSQSQNLTRGKEFTVEIVKPVSFYPVAVLRLSNTPSSGLHPIIH